MDKENQRIKYFAYTRKSSEEAERQALSIESQQDTVKETFGKIEIVEILGESKSAFTPYNRPIFAKMMERIKRGEAEGIIAWHPDRLSRNEIDAATITYMVRTGELKDLKFVSYHFDNSPEGIMMLQMALSHSQYHSAKLGTDVKRGLAKKAKLGWLTGVSPNGYLNTPDREKGFKTLIKDPERFPLLRRAIDYLLTGNYTPMQVLKMLNEDWGFRTVKRKTLGGKPLSRSAFYKFLSNSFYYGWFEFPKGSENWYKGEHELMITRKEFDRIQALLKRKGKPAPHRKVFAFTGLIRCGECGCLITAEDKIKRQKNGNIHYYTYYHCTKKKESVRCTQPSIRVERVEEQIDEFLEGVQIDQKYLDWAIKHLKKSHKLESSSREAMLQSQQRSYNEIVQKLDRLLEIRMNNELTEEEYLEKKARLINEREHYNELLQDTEGRQDKWLELSERTFNFARYARFWFAEAVETSDYQQQREVLATLGSHLVLEDKKLSINAAEPFVLIKKALVDIPEARERLEPAKNLINKRKGEPNCSLNPRWLRGQDSNLQPSP